MIELGHLGRLHRGRVLSLASEDDQKEDRGTRKQGQGEEGLEVSEFLGCQMGCIGEKQREK